MTSECAERQREEESLALALACTCNDVRLMYGNNEMKTMAFTFVGLYGN